MERDYSSERNRKNLIWCDEYLELEQALITNKNKHNAFSVEREYINSKLYHDKFEKLPVNKEVQESIYREAGRLLEFIDNLEEDRMSEERLLAIDARTGEFLVDNFNRSGDTYKTGFDSKEQEVIEKCLDSIVLLHNHSLNGRLSGQDLLAYLHHEKIKLSLILCHDGTIYGIYGVKKVFEDKYNKFLEAQKRRTNDENEAKRLAMSELYRINEELSDRHKFFNVQKL